MPALLNPEDEALVRRVQSAYESGKDHHESFRKKADRFYAKYRSYRDFKRDYDRAKPRDVDELLRETAGPFGTNLFIPYCFTVIETTVPRMLSTNPRMLITPADEASEASVDNVKLLIDRQQARISYPLILQDVAKTGLMYGLAWQKIYWEEGPRGRRPGLERGVSSVHTVNNQARPKRGYCGPMAEALDPYDVIWDPVAHTVEGCRWVIHRMWRDNAFVKAMVDSHEWELPSGIDLDYLLGLGSDEARDDIWKDRMAAAGYARPDRRGDQLHEVWEYHDAITGDVITLVDRLIPVMVSENPYWHGQLPFQVFRPTRVPFEMVGISEIEAIEDLQDEMNMMRSERRDAARLALQAPYFYFDGLVDPNDFVFGPGKAIPVEGNPRDVLFAAPINDVPGSSYQEDQRLQADIERTSGIDDSIAGGGDSNSGASATATGAQLVTAAAGIRIQYKTRRIEQETVKPACRQFVELNQQYIVEPQTVPGPPRPDEAHKHYSFYKIGPDELAGEFEDVEPEGGSMSPQSKVERQERAKNLWMLFANNPLVNQRKLITNALEEGFEVENPEGSGWVAPEEPSIPPEAMDLVRDTLAQTGVDPMQFDELVAAAVREIEQLQQGGGPQEPPASDAPPEGMPG